MSEVAVENNISDDKSNMPDVLSNIQVEDITVLDDTWVKEHKKEERDYNKFYKEQQDKINIAFMYVDTQNTITYGKKVMAGLDNGILKKQTLIDILNENMHYNEIKYRPISMIKWNINIGPELLGEYLQNDVDDGFDFMNIEEEIRDINFEDSISILHDINCLYILFHESWKSYNNRSKKIYIKSSKLKRKKQTKRLKK